MVSPSPSQYHKEEQDFGMGYTTILPPPRPPPTYLREAALMQERTE